MPWPSAPNRSALTMRPATVRASAGGRSSAVSTRSPSACKTSTEIVLSIMVRPDVRVARCATVNRLPNIRQLLIVAHPYSAISANIFAVQLIEASVERQENDAAYLHLLFTGRYVRALDPRAVSGRRYRHRQRHEGRIRVPPS